METRSEAASRFRLSSYASLIASAIILVGLVLRLRQYLANRSLWLDEAALALNIIHRSFADLTQPLDHLQGAPIAFLYIEKLAVLMLGDGEYVLRLFPLLAGCLSLFLMYRLSRHCVSQLGTLFALGLFAILWPPIYFSSEAKQYSTDVAVALLLYLAGWWFLEHEAGIKHFLLLGAAGAIAGWLSHPALFVLGGAGFTLLLKYSLDRHMRGLRNLGFTIGIWLAGFILLYVVSLQGLASNTRLLDFWQNRFMPVPPWRDLQWFATSLESLFADATGLSSPFLITVLIFCVGSVSLLTRRWYCATLLLLPVFLTLLASGLRKYPFGDRLLLFAVPSVLIVLAEGLDRIRYTLRRIPWLSVSSWLLLAGYLLYAPLWSAQHNLLDPYLGEHIRPALAYLETEVRSSDLIYVYGGAGLPFRFYAPSYGFSHTDYVVGRIEAESPDGPIPELDALRRHGRVWVVFSHTLDWGTVDKRATILEYLDRIGRRENEYKASGASVHLYDFDTEP